MAITSYSELKSAIADWMARTDVSGSTSDFISLAEARLNRELQAVEVDAALTGVVGSREIDVSALAIDRALALFFSDNGSEHEVDPASATNIVYTDENGAPSQWVWDDGKIKFDRPLDLAYPVRFRYDQKFALSDAAPTNWLLTNHPDLYLAASIAWGGAYIRDDITARWDAAASDFIAQVRHDLASRKRSTLRADPALVGSIGRYGLMS